MTPYQLHHDGDCNPWSCSLCANQCDVCGNHLLHCDCPTLPLDEEDQP